MMNQTLKLLLDKGWALWRVPRMGPQRLDVRL